MTFQEWFNSAPHRAKYSNDNPAYLAAQEAWEAAHEACAKAFEEEAITWHAWPQAGAARRLGAAAIRARSGDKK